MCIRDSNKSHVIRPVDQYRDGVSPNYNGTGKALVGVLKPKQTFEAFKENWIANNYRSMFL
jgi:hypothetical protein